MWGRRALIAVAALLALPLAGTLFASEHRQLHVAAGAAPLCRDGVSLGSTEITTEFVWRAAIVANALREAVARAPCLADATWEGSASAATRIVVRVYEAGPVLLVGLLPPHWLGFSEVELAVTAHDLRAPGAPLYDAHLRLARGGLFALRGTPAVERDAGDAFALLLGEAPVR
jgi:hypothetical protein